MPSARYSRSRAIAAGPPGRWTGRETPDPLDTEASDAGSARRRGVRGAGSRVDIRTRRTAKAADSVRDGRLPKAEPKANLQGNGDNYLHEAAQAAKPPSGTVYDPNGTGRPLASLGVHEHWNNARDKKYSRNLGGKEGIELIAELA
jgi:hypothetical protein